MNMQSDLSTVLPMLLSMFTPQVPIILVSVVALVVILVKWKLAPQACLWALLGFGLRLVLCVVVPVVQTLVQYSAMHGERSPQNMGLIFTGLSVLWSGLGAVSYGFMLAAIFAGRSKPATWPQAPQPSRG
jgi:hypothetical protein